MLPGNQKFKPNRAARLWTPNTLSHFHWEFRWSPKMLRVFDFIFCLSLKCLFEMLPGCSFYSPSVVHRICLCCHWWHLKEVKAQRPQGLSSSSSATQVNPGISSLHRSQNWSKQSAQWLKATVITHMIRFFFLRVHPPTSLFTMSTLLIKIQLTLEALLDCYISYKMF